ncbi:hypothetical protein BT69DRAFT_1325032 [Atractiella rhizophila]|nr:hypothetical protein BT69DRAFT_1325032 [Atractiella rhizophila]
MRPTYRQLINVRSIGGRNLPIKRYRGELEKKVTLFESLNISKGSRMNRDSGLPTVVPTLVSFPNVSPPSSTYMHMYRPNPTPEVPYSLTLSTLNHPLWNPPHPKAPFKRVSALSGEEEGRVEGFAKRFGGGGAGDLFAEGGETAWLEEEETEEMRLAKEKRKERERQKEKEKQDAIKAAQAKKKGKK